MELKCPPYEMLLILLVFALPARMCVYIVLVCIRVEQIMPNKERNVPRSAHSRLNRGEQSVVAMTTSIFRDYFSQHVSNDACNTYIPLDGNTCVSCHSKFISECSELDLVIEFGSMFP